MNPYVKCYCISLRDNEEGRILCQKEFDKINLQVEFEIVERSPLGGKHGCFTSHIQVLKKGLATSAPYIMIMEDDVYFDYQDPQIFNKINEFISLQCDSLCQVKWCFCLGYLTNSPATKVIDNYCPQVTINTDSIVALDKCYCAHAYIVPRVTAEALVTMEWKEVPYDIHWHEMIDKFYAPYPMIAFQRDHQSETAKDFGGFLLNLIGFRNIARISEFRSRLPF